MLVTFCIAAYYRFESGSAVCSKGPKQLAVNIFVGGSGVAVCAVVMVCDFHCYVKMILKIMKGK